MNKEEAEQRAQELIDFYGSGAYKGPQEVDMGNGRIGVRMIATWPGFAPTIKDMTMSKNERDTHFQGAAKVLWEKMMAIQGGEIGWIDVASDGLDNEWIEKFQQLIAQFLYDFMGATVRYESTCIDIELYSGEAITLEECIRRIPDMAE